MPVLLLLAWLVAAASPAAAQEPRLPGPQYPGATLESLEAAGQNDASPAPVEAIILRARLLSRAGRFSESAQAWQTVGAKEPALAAFGRNEAIRSLLDAGDLQPALDLLTQAKICCAGNSATSVPPDVLLRAAGVTRGAGQIDRAVDLYRQARNAAGRTQAADEAALGLAAAQEQAGRAREALETFRELQLTFRQAAAYDEAEAGARRLSVALGGADPLSEQDYDAIADRLAGVAAFTRAIAVLREWQRAFPDSAQRARIDLAIIQDLYALRANGEARAAAENFLKQYPDNPNAASAFRTLFSLDVREGRTEDAERRGRAILEGRISGATLDQRQGAGRLLAEYLVSVGQAGRALPVYERLSRITTARGERIDLLWRTAIASLRAGRAPTAINQLTQVRRLKLDSETDRATGFWLASAQQAAGLTAPAQALWATLVERYPFSYYGERAAARLNAALPAATLAFPDLTLRDAVTAYPDYRAAAALSRAGLLPEAAAYARRVSGAFRRDDAAALMAARAAHAAADPSATATLMSSYFGEFLEKPAAGLPADFWELAYPLAYWNEISAAAMRHHVDPLLMIALVRQESHFERAVKSPVGAIGLFQIMPTTAAELDPEFTIDEADTQLVKPDVAAELAATLLERNLARFQGALAPAIASYNADMVRVQVWWDAAKGTSEELFVDSIPYLQTRAYVRQVLANYSMYRRFAAPPPSPQR